MKVTKHLYLLFQEINTTNYDCMKELNSYTKVVKYYGGGNLIHPFLVRSKLIKMEVHKTDNLTT